LAGAGFASVYLGGSSVTGVAVITGASSGIGAATAIALGRHGYRIVAGARRVERLERVAGEDGLALHLDVTDEDSVRAFVAEVRKKLGRIDVRVNNAGGALGLNPIAEARDEEWIGMWQTNVLGLMWMTRECLPLLRKAKHGHIVNIGSIAGRQAYPDGSLYVTSKFAVRGFTYALREDLLGRPIHVTTVDPGLVETNFSRVRFRGDEETARKVYEGVEAMTPDDIAECVLFAVTRPPHVNVDELVVKALAQSSGARIIRN
jgi:3-hydroxy acid dehydrogenase / malonic semialdehyde reductase